jgi:hypothetical protein
MLLASIAEFERELIRERTGGKLAPVLPTKLDRLGPMSFASCGAISAGAADFLAEDRASASSLEYGGYNYLSGEG